MRKRIYEIISTSDEASTASRAYDAIMVACVIASLVPLCFKESNVVFAVAEAIITVFFICDYLLRLATADIHLKRGFASFARYPFTPMAILDLVSILPGLIEINPAFRALRIARLLKLLRIFRFIRYSKSLNIVMEVVRNEKNLLLCVFGLAFSYVLASAMIVFNIEPDTFDTFFDAIYWACVSLTTVGYGDIFCETMVGKVFTILGTFVGTAVIALPAGIITGGFVEQMQKRSE